MKKILPILAILFGLGQPLQAEITPQKINSLPPIPQVVVEELKKHENYELATNQVKVVYKTPNNDIGYGVTPDEVKDAISEGFLPKGSTLPSKMNAADAKKWLHTITIPTYRSIVRKNVRVPLTLHQEAALVIFTQNTGRGNLKKLINGPSRLNSGNYSSVVEVMPLYYSKPGKFFNGLQKRVKFQLALFEGKPFKRKP